jgi:hypothetical protein
MSAAAPSGGGAGQEKMGVQAAQDSQGWENCAVGTAPFGHIPERGCVGGSRAPSRAASAPSGFPHFARKRRFNPSKNCFSSRTPFGRPIGAGDEEFNLRNDHGGAANA